MAFLTPLAALVALAVLAPLGALLLARIRAGAARRELGLAPPPRSSSVRRPACGVAAVLLLALAAAQPALTHTSSRRERTDAAALFVFDTSRSMQASATPDAPTRLQRAVAAAVKLRAAIPGVPAGIATLTDRVLPDLLPVPDRGTFDGVARRAVSIEDPPPISNAVIGTSFAALRQVAGGDYFAPHVTRRLVILLSDGESAPVNPGQVAHALARSHGYRLLAVRIGNAGERVFGAGGRAEPGYQPNPAAASIIGGLAAATGGRTFSEGAIGAAGSDLRALAGTGPSVEVGQTRSRQTLAPFVAGLAGVLLLAALLPSPLADRRRARRRLGFRRRAGDATIRTSQAKTSHELTGL